MNELSQSPLPMFSLRRWGDPCTSAQGSLCKRKQTQPRNHACSGPIQAPGGASKLGWGELLLLSRQYHWASELPPIL
jgi:hypothetical protein